jgi:hypothetical protein
VMPRIHRRDEQRPCVLQIGYQCHAHHADDELPPTVRPEYAGRGLLIDIVHAPCLRYFLACGRPSRRAPCVSPYGYDPNSLAIREYLIFASLIRIIRKKSCLNHCFADQFFYFDQLSLGTASISSFAAAMRQIQALTRVPG